MFDFSVGELREEIIENKVMNPYRIGLMLDRAVYERFQRECEPLSVSSIIHLYMVKELRRLDAKKKRSKK